MERELRIGNWMLKEGKEKEISAFDIYDFTTHPKLDLKPIEITQQWLERLGFEYESPGIQGADMWQGLGYWSLFNDGISLILRGDKNVSHPLKLNGYWNSDFKYIHTLQNLFFSLTGQELKPIEL